jgi:hypothetical protein
VKLGVLLPLFRSSTDDALAAADLAANLGVDGVFAYDHLYPIGHPERPALRPFPVLAAVAARHEVAIAPLVARVGLVDDATLVGEFTALHTLAPGRTIAALGLGDQLSAAEHARYGISLAPLAERRARLHAIALELAALEMPVWVGGSGPTAIGLARALGAAVNCWAVTPERVAALASDGEVTWAGDLPSGVDEMARHLEALAAAGATWCVSTYQTRTEDLARAAALVGWSRSR